MSARARKLKRARAAAVAPTAEGRRRDRRAYDSGVPGDELEILDVAPEPGDGVRGHFRVSVGEGHRVQIVGWALGRESPAIEVEVVADGSVAGRAPVAVERPDVAQRFPDVAQAATAGFRVELAAKGRGESRLEVFAVLKDDSRRPLGRILVRAPRRGLLDVLRRG